MTQTELSGCNDSEPHLMSLETSIREPSRCLNGEGCHGPLSNSQTAAQHLGGVSEGDRTARADRVSRENSSGESATQPAVQGGEPTEAARAAGVVGVPHSSDDPPESKTGGERRRGTWVKARGHSEGSDDGRTEAATLFDRITTPPKVQKLQRVLYRKAKVAPGYRFYNLYGELLRRDVLETAMSAVAQSPVGDEPAGSSTGTLRPVSAADEGGLETGRGVEAMCVNGPRKAGCGKTARPV